MLKAFLEKVWDVVVREALVRIFPDANAGGLEPDGRLTVMWLWTLFSGTLENGTGDDEDEDAEEDAAKRSKVGGFVMEYDAARKIAQGLGVHLEALTSLVEVKGEMARLLGLGERAKLLFGPPDAGSELVRRKKPKKQMRLLGLVSADEQPAPAAGASSREPGPAAISATVLERVHQAMILFGQNRGALLKRVLVDDGVGGDERFWQLAVALKKLYPAGSRERKLVDGVLSKRSGLGL